MHSDMFYSVGPSVANLHSYRIERRFKCCSVEPVLLSSNFVCTVLVQQNCVFCTPHHLPTFILHNYNLIHPICIHTISAWRWLSSVNRRHQSANHSTGIHICFAYSLCNTSSTNIYIWPDSSNNISNILKHPGRYDCNYYHYFIMAYNNTCSDLNVYKHQEDTPHMITIFQDW